MLLPYRTASGSSRTDFAPRQPGDLTLMFCDGALSAFLVDTTPTASSGSYVPNADALDRFYEDFAVAVRAERAQLSNAKRSGLQKFAGLFGSAWNLLSPPPRPVTPVEVIAEWIDSLVNSGEQDDITVMAAID